MVDGNKQANINRVVVLAMYDEIVFNDSNSENRIVQDDDEEQTCNQ